MTACIEGHHDIVQLLLEHEADPEMADKDGKSAEDLAKENNNVQLVLSLIYYFFKFCSRRN